MDYYNNKYATFIGPALGATAVLTLLPLVLLFGQLRGKIEERSNISDFPFSITAYGIQYSLPQNQIGDMVKDSITGELVFSTANGIVRFNGYEFKNFREHVSFRRTIFTRIFYCPLKKAFYGWEENGEFSLLADTVVLQGNFMAADIRKPYFVTIDSSGLIDYFQYVRNNRQKLETGIHSATFIYMVNDTSCLVGADGNGYLVALNTGEKKLFKGEKWINAVQDAKTNSTYVVSRNRAFRVQGGEMQEIRVVADGKPDFTDVEVVEDMVVFTSRRGMFILSPSGVSYYSEKDVFPTNLLTCLYYDRYEGCLFVGTSTRGLLKLIPRRCWSIYKNELEFQYSFGAMVSLGNGRIVVNGDQNVRTFPENEKLEPENFKAALSGLSLFGDTLAAMGWDGWLRGYSISLQKRIFQFKYTEKPSFALFRDRNGDFWTGTEEGVYRSRNLVHTTRFLPTKIKKKITTFYEDSRGRLWFAGENGVFVLDKDRRLEMQFDTGSIASAQDIRAFYEGRYGEIWIGTYGAGLFCYRNGRLVSLKQMDNYLLGNDIFTLARDKYGYLLMSSNNGIRVVQEEVLYNYLNGKIVHLVPFYVGEHSGIFIPEFNGGFHNNYASEGDSIFYFPGIQGYVRYVSRPFLKRTDNLQISQVLLDGKPVDRPFRIPRKIKFIRFDFFDANFSETQNLYYQYKLTDRDGSNNWSKLQKEPFLVFSHLGPGKYTLSIRVVDGYNALVPPSVAYEFYIPPYFYESFFFYLILLLGTLLILIAHLERRFGKQKKEIERELELRNALTEMQLVAIQSQMNPHFLFNSLNTLVNMISSNYLEKAEKFAIDLSQLLRRILEQSGKNFVLIQEEIGTLMKFMEIQQARFDFDFAIHCPHELRDKKIPTMLLQPLVENAIIHGIAHLLEEKGKITLDFSSPEEGKIQVDLRDNGVGFKQSVAIYAGKKKKSMGLEMVKRKIALLHDRYKIVVELKMEELDRNGQSGTHMCLIIKSHIT